MTDPGESVNHTRLAYEGTIKYRNIDFRVQMVDGQSITSVEWETESPVELVIGSSGFDGTVISGAFDTTDCVEGQGYTITGIANTANPTERLKDYIILQILPIPVG